MPNPFAQRLQATLDHIETIRTDLAAQAKPEIPPERVAEYVSEEAELFLLDALADGAPRLYELGLAFGVIEYVELPPLTIDGTPEGELLRLPSVAPRVGLAQLLRTMGNPFAGFLDAESEGDDAETAQAFLDFFDAWSRKFDRVLKGDVDLIGMSVVLNPDQLEVTGFDPPLTPAGTSFEAELPIPSGGAPSIKVNPSSLRLAWSEAPSPGAARPLFEVAGIVVSIPATPDAAASARLDFEPEGPQLTARGGLDVVLPAGFASRPDGSPAVKCYAQAELVATAGRFRIDVKEVSIDVTELRLGGPDGVLVKTANVTLSGLSLPGAPGQVPEFALGASGKVRLGDSWVSVNTNLAKGRFKLTSTGEVELGEGITLGPIDDQPVLAFDVGLGPASEADSIAVAGRIELEQDGADPVQIDLSGSLTVERFADGVLRVIHCAVAGALANWRPVDELLVESAQVQLTYSDAQGFELFVGGSAGLLEREQPALTGLDAFRLQIAKVGVRIAFRTDGFELTLESGSATFADPVFLQPDSKPSLAVDAEETLVLDVTTSPQFAFSAAGRLVVSDLGVEFGAFSATLTRAELAFAGGVLPTFEHVNATVKLPLPSGQLATFETIDGMWDLDGLPLGSIENEQNLVLLGDGGFELSLVGDQGSPSSIALLADGDDVVLELSGLARLAIPAEMLQRDASDPQLATKGPEIHIDSGGTFRVPLTSSGEWGFHDLALGFSSPGARWRLGADDEDALLLIEPSLVIAGIENLLAPSEDDPLTIQLGGTVQMGQGGPGLILSGGGFDIVSWGELPVFLFGEIGFIAPEADQSVELVPAGPFRLKQFLFGSRKWLDDGIALPLPEVLAPENIVIRCSVELAIPFGDGGSAGFQADNLELRVVGAGGLPTISLDGIGFGAEDITIYPALKVSGAFRLGGLKHLFPTDGQPPDPSQVFAAGKLGAIVQGTGAQILLAADLFPVPQPLGACLDVKISQGIQIAYGFVVTGVSGGISYANTNADPCEIRSYIHFPDEGPPSRIDVPEPTETPEAALAAGDPMPTERPTKRTDCPSCPGQCPPPSMNLLCQPHPDVAYYPGRAILKFSSLDREFLDRVEIGGLSARDWIDWIDWIDSAQGSVGQIVATLVDQIELRLDQLLPDLEVDPDLLASLPEEFVTILGDPVGYMGSQLRTALVSAASQATGGLPLSKIVENTLHRGIDCPDSTLQLTGSFSYTGVSMFLSITGGVNVSTAGSAGVLGSVDVFGIPVGTARVFVTGTSATGGIQPGFCGDIKAVFGPLELGQLALAAKAPELGEGQLGALVMTLTELAEEVPGLVTQMLAATDPPLWSKGQPMDVNALTARVNAIADLPDEQRATAVATILCRLLDQQLEVAVEAATAVEEAVKRLGKRLWQRTNPSITMCGTVAPKLFGLPLSGELLGVSSWITKERIGAEFRFSPTYLLGRVFPPADFFSGVDQAVLGFDLPLPDPFDLLTVQPFLDDGISELLEQATLALSYTLAPLGVELVAAQGRVVMPRLENHPAAQAGSWKRPEKRNPGAPPNQQLPSRSEVLIAALEGRRLGGVTWKGELEQLEIPDRAPLTGLLLREDYFPHGGIVGAGRLTLPKILTDGIPPDLWRDIVAPEDPNPLVRAGKVFQLVTGYILEAEGVGSLAFYLPAPNPPMLLDEQGDAPSVAELIGSLNGIDAATLAPGPLFSAEEAFMSGRLDVQLLGLPIGEARIEAVPPTPKGEEGLFEITARTAADSWLSALIGEVELTFRVRQPPPLPIAVFFEAFESVTQALDGDAAVAATLVDDVVDEVLAKFRQQAAKLREDLSDDAGFDGNADLPAADVAADFADGLRAALEQVRAALAGEREPAFAEALVTQLTAAISSQLPKISLEVEVEVQTPDEYADLVAFEGSGRLLAFSPGYEVPRLVAASAGTSPGSGLSLMSGGALTGGASFVSGTTLAKASMAVPAEESVAQRVRRQGGLLLEVEDLRVQAGPFGAQVDLARLALVPFKDGIAFEGRAAVSAFVDDGSSKAWNLLDASLVFSVDPTPTVTLLATSAGFSLGVIEVEPLDLGGELVLEVATQPARVRVSPARIVVGAFGVETEIVVPEQFTLEFDADWSLTVEVRRLVVPHPLDPDGEPLVDLEDLLSGTLAMTDGVLTLELPASGLDPIQIPPLPLVPLAPLTCSGEIERLFVASDGRLDFHGTHTLEVFGGLASATGRLDVVIGDAAATAEGGNGLASVTGGLLGVRRSAVDLSRKATRPAPGGSEASRLRSMDSVRESTETVRMAHIASAVRRVAGRSSTTSSDRLTAEDTIIRAAVSERVYGGRGALFGDDVERHVSAARRFLDAQRELEQRGRRTQQTPFSFRLSQASLTIPDLPTVENGALVFSDEPLVEDAELRIDTSRVFAQIDFGQRWLGLPLLAEVQAGAWVFEAYFDTGAIELHSLESPALRLLGTDPVASASIDFSHAPDGGSLTVCPKGPIVVIPSLLRVTFDCVELTWQLSPPAVWLSAQAVIEVLDLDNDDFRYERYVDLGTGDSELALLNLPNGFLGALGLDAPWLGDSAFPKLAITRDAQGNFELELRNLAIVFPGVTGKFSGLISQTGVVEITLEDFSLANALFEVELDSEPSVRFDLLSPFETPRVELPGGVINSTSIAGFPDVDFDGFTATGGQLSFTARLDGSEYSGSFEVPWPLDRISYKLASPTLVVSVSGDSITARIEPGGIKAWTKWRCPGSNKPFASASFDLGSAALNAQGNFSFTLPESKWSLCDLSDGGFFSFAINSAISTAKTLLGQDFSVSLKVDDLF